MSGGISDALEASIREYSKYLLGLSGKTAGELEFMNAEMHNVLDMQTRDVRKTERQVILFLQFLTEMHGKTAIVNLGIDPHSMQPIVKSDSDDLMF